MGEKTRIYIGGLGSSVQEDDLRKTFTSPQLGTVESVEIIRSKGRSFGYLGFTPASDKGLAKLFSTYNGCMWKGSRLKLEKAKEDYLARLRREWEEETELKNKSSSEDADKDKSVPMLEKPKKQLDIEKMQLKIFFPKLRKLKPIPLKGTGKNKYSFQRVEVPPLPIHFCDCEEHSGPHLAKRKWTDAHETKDHGTNVQGAGIYEVSENELNMMKTILDKFLEKDSSENVPNEADFSEETNNDVTSADNLQVDNEMEEGVSDEDDLLINVTNKARKRVDVFKDWGYKTTSVKNQDSLLTVAKSSSEPTREKSKNKNARLLADKKRKLPDQNNAKDTVPSESKAGKKVWHGSEDERAVTNTQSTQMGSDSVELSRDMASSQKSVWRNLVWEKESCSFHISDILMAQNPEPEAKPRSNDPTVDLNVSGKDEQADESSDDEESEKVLDVESAKLSTSDDKIARGASDEQGNESSDDEESETVLDVESTKLSTSDDKIARGASDEQGNESSEDEESEKAPDVESTKPSISDDKIARGAAWLQKSSWLQLVADANSNAFSIGQILPDVTLERQESQQNDVLNSRSGEQNEVGNADWKAPIGDTGKSQANPNVSSLTKEPYCVSRDDEQPRSEVNQTVETDEACSPLHSSNSVMNYRPMGDAIISETCPFMRSSASMKEWAKTKAALSGSHKKKGKGIHL